MHKLQVLVRQINGLLCRDLHHGELLGIKKPKLRLCVLKLKRVLTHCVLELNRVLTYFTYLKFYYQSHILFSYHLLKTSYPPSTSSVINVELRDRRPLQMLPYPTHAHPIASAHGHAYSHPKPNDQNFQKRHGRS